MWVACLLPLHTVSPSLRFGLNASNPRCFRTLGCRYARDGETFRVRLTQVRHCQRGPFPTLRIHRVRRHWKLSSNHLPAHHGVFTRPFSTRTPSPFTLSTVGVPNQPPAYRGRRKGWCRLTIRLPPGMPDVWDSNPHYEPRPAYSFVADRQRDSSFQRLGLDHHCAPWWASSLCHTQPFVLPLYLCKRAALRPTRATGITVRSFVRAASPKYCPSGCKVGFPRQSVPD